METEHDIYDVIIVGAGPCGLAAAARLRERTPDALFTDEEHRRFHWIGKHGGKVSLKHVKSGKMTTRRGAARAGPPDYKMVVLDATADKWMAKWDSLFGMFDISHLRSPMIWHADPFDRDSLLAYTYENRREKELVEIRNCVGKEVSKHGHKKNAGRQCGGKQAARVVINLRDRNDYYTPSQGVFRDHCCQVAKRYKLDSGLIRQEGVTNIEYGYVDGISESSEEVFTITTDKVVRYARTVIMAVGAANVPKLPHMPSVVALTDPAIDIPACHSMKIKEFPHALVKQRIQARQSTNVLVVGGGLTSAQITDLAVRRGVTKVWHIMRGRLRVKLFDLDLQWMGKYKNTEHARFWLADSDEERLDIIKEARGGGSITPVFHKQLKKHISTGRVELITETQIVDAKLETIDDNGRSRQVWRVITEPPLENAPLFDYMYFATGIQTDLHSLPYLQTMLASHPIQSRGGLPCLNDDLMWKDGVPLFMMGRLAALRLGPGAANLGGAKVGAERVAWAIEDIVHRQQTKAVDSGVELSDDDEENDNKADGMAVYLSGHGNMYSALADDDGEN